MSETNSRHGARFKGWLIAGYGTVFILFIGGLGIERFQESPVISHDVIPFSLMALIFSTILVQANSKSSRIERSDIIKGLACLIGTFACGFVAVKLMPDTQLGVLVIIAAFIAPLLGFVYYLSKVGGAGLRAMRVGVLSAETVPVDVSASDRGSKSEATFAPDRVEIPVNYRAILMRFAIWVGLVVLFWWSFGQVYPIVRIVMPIAALPGFIKFGRYLTGRGAAMVMDENGIAVRRSISSSIDRLPWPDIAYFGLKSILYGTYLVIYLKNPEAIIAKQGVLTRWFMGQSLNMFESPVRIPLFALKCDQNWLVQTADAIRRKYNLNIHRQ
jgi:hypothetical protein